MTTLDRWRAFLTTPRTLHFPRLELIGRDHAPPIVVGSGEVRMASPAEFTFTLTGTPADIRYALAEIQQQQENRYDGLARFRLVGVDAEGTRWAGGYTIPQVDPGDRGWTFEGEINSLSTDEASAAVAREAGTELIFLVPPGRRMSLAMRRFVPTSQAGGRERVMDICGSAIRFTYEPSAGTLSIAARHSSELLAPYAENWLGEPLLIMFGQLIYPRLGARNFGDGRALVWIRRSPDRCRLGGALAAHRGSDQGPHSVLESLCAASRLGRSRQSR